MALYLCKNADGTGIVSAENPLETKHTSAGEPMEIPVYIFNDGKRKGVENDKNPPPLIYTNIQIRVEGVAYTLEKALSPSALDVTVQLSSTEGWNIGTILKSGLERMRVEEILTAKSIRVTRNYDKDGISSTIQGHSIGALFVADATSVSLALPSIANTTEAGTYLAGGEAMTTGLDPSYLTNTVNDLDSSTLVRSSNAGLYTVGSLIKINNEIMKITNISNNDITVIRGYGTNREAHSANSIIYCVGIVDVSPITHKIFIKNDPPSGLPTQKKRDISVVIVADEEPA